MCKNQKLKTFTIYFEFQVFNCLEMAGLSENKVKRNRDKHSIKIDNQVELYNQKLSDEFIDNNAIIVGDSKVRNLYDICNTRNHVRMIWRKGASIDNVFLNRETLSHIARYRNRGPVTVILWHGTCELTNIIDRGTLHINFSNQPNIVNQIATNYRNYKDRILHRYPETKVLFLEVPMYSITLWNAKRKHPHPSIFELNQTRLETAIAELNRLIKAINQPEKVPCISQDMSFFIKKKKGQPQTKKINYDLLVDGIHLDKPISSLWLARIKLFINKD